MLIHRRVSMDKRIIKMANELIRSYRPGRQIVVNYDNKSIILNDTEDIDRFIHDIENMIKNDPVKRDQILKHIAGKKVIEKYDHNYEVDKVDIDREIDDFINLQKSPSTKTVYRCYVDRFINWCKSEGLDPRKITRRDIDSFTVYIGVKLNLSSNTVRLNMGSVSSFYKFLMIRNQKLFLVSPFAGVKYPKVELVRRVDKITHKDVIELKNKLKKINRKDCLIAIDLMTKYGLRVGSFQNMIIDKKQVAILLLVRGVL
jgi:hypothetical protein